MIRPFTRLLAAGALCLIAAGCLTGGGQSSRSGGKLRLQFWHTRRGEQEKALQGICRDYGTRNPDVEIEPLYQGDYDRLNQKIRASIQAKDLPALAVGYESQVVEYAQAGVLVSLEPLVKDRELGFSEEELADIPAPYLESNRFAQFGSQLLSFPFTKSTLLLFYNKDLLKQAGFDAPPETWEEFEKQSAAVTARTGKAAFVFDSDPSTLDGMIYSFGGKLLGADGRTLFHQEPAVRTFELLRRMAKAKTLTWATGDDAANLFLAGGSAFSTGTSSSRAQAEEQIGSAFAWDVAVLPHAPGVAPVTVMYGPNVCLFKSTPDKEREAWRFVKFFVSPEITARWARETGYLPVRKSAVDLPEMKQFYEQNPRARRIYEITQSAVGEPNVLGWQEVRDLLKAASNSVITSGADPAKTAADLKRKADKVLAESR